MTCLAISADHTIIGAGHSGGSIFTWELASPARPFLALPSLPRSSLSDRRADGHVEGCAVLHIGFLGQRRTALVSADDHGMAFSHLASRGLGAVARTIRTTRILGRYPDTGSTPAARKPSSVLGFASLPLGNVERLTDDVGLTAVLTPYLLVIVSTTPIAQTQFKLSREKHLDPHSAMTGCLAWFPAVKLASPMAGGKASTSKSKLVYCWSTMLSVLDVEEIRPPQDEPDKQPSFNFTPRSQWKSEEAIVAVQWLSRSVLAALTISQRLIILEDHVMRLADSSDLNAKHIYHQDLYSNRLRSLVDKTEDGENAMHGVIPDAFHMSFKAYKGRLFLLGFGDVLMGVLSNWADRLQALLDRREYLTAIKLATMYYTGDTEKVTIGLLEDDDARQTMVGKKLLEIMSAALQYMFNDDSDDNEKDFEQSIQDLVEAMFRSCLTINERDFLFDTVYEYYSDASRQDTFLYTLEPYILDRDIDLVPPLIMKDLLIWYASHDLGPRLEDIICAVQPFTIDIDQVTTICKALELYDALAYVWSQALGDYITPLVELLKLIQAPGASATSVEAQQESARTAASKLFPFLAYTLTGRRYPDGAELSAYDAMKAKASVYGFLFSAGPVRWPTQGGKLALNRTNVQDELHYPYLQILLHFDTEDFLSMLNEAFEDSFLNGGNDQIIDGLSANELRVEAFGMVVNRQRITNILLEVMKTSDFSIQERIYLDIFVARNLSKFAQFILLPGSVIRHVLVELCQGGELDMEDECQLSVEYLLSVYHPTDMQDLIEAFTRAGFYRILKSVYKSNRQYPKWLETHFNDQGSRSTVFTAMAECLKSGFLNEKQTRDINDIIVQHAEDLAEIDTPRTVFCLQTFAPDLLKLVFDQYKDRPRLQYSFLEIVYEPALGRRDGAADRLADKHIELYVRLMCQYNPAHVADYVSLLKSGDLHLNNVLPAMEASGVIDAAVILLARGGLISTAMSRLIRHLSTLETAITGLLIAAYREEDAFDVHSTEEAVKDLLDSVNKYVKLGIWLCQGQAQASQQPVKPRQSRPPHEILEEDLAPEERLWLDFLDMVVGFSRDVTASVESSVASQGELVTGTVQTKAVDTLRLMVQQTFTALLASTSSVASTTRRSLKPRLSGSSRLTPQANPGTATSSSQKPRQAQPPNSHAFLRILRTLLTRLSTNTNSPASLPSLRAILSQIFSAYAFESSLLDLATGFLDKDVFLHIEEAETKRRRGWTPNNQGCEGCGRRVFGSGLGVGVWDDWKKRKDDNQGKWGNKWGVDVAGEVQDQDGRSDDQAVNKDVEAGVSGRRTPIAKEKGKGKSRATTPEPPLTSDSQDQRPPPQKANTQRLSRKGDAALVIFACGHAFHRSCLEKVLPENKAAADKAGGEDRYQCPVSHAGA